ncbi:DUF1002 domain-containing protein [uncultured Clostridium sp.]|uniref:DUF1002 domain-containing protein n=1 Tax=uncultured Clostridium sp. TaxID=59620 RepID=UPI0025E1B84E|nr:DUF1002 domain-containing protein [uncultured Clostridium sp.]
MISKKKFISSILCISLLLGNVTLAHADSSKVVTLGADLSESQKQTVLDYFGVKKDEAVILEVNNLEERKYLQGIASEAQLGTRTFSCAYVEPAKKGNGINVKTANLTYVTSSMIASTLATCGVEDANVIAMTPLSGGVSGTGALTGVMKAFEDATGEQLSEDKKEIASEELITTSDLGDEIGQDKAAGIVNDVKANIIKNGTQDTNQIAETINNVTNNYNITLTSQQEKQLSDLMTKISQQDYDYDKLKNTFKNVSDNVDKNLKEAGIDIKHSQGFFSSIGDWFKDLFSGSKDLGILEKTNDTVLGDDVKVDATDKEAIKKIVTDEGFWSKIRNWFSDLFKSSDNKSESTKQSENNTNANPSSDAENTSSTLNSNTETNSESNTTDKDSDDSSSQSQSTENSVNNTQN